MFHADTAIRLHVAPNARAFPISANYSLLILVAFVTLAQIRASFAKNCENANTLNNFHDEKFYSA